MNNPSVTSSKTAAAIIALSALVNLSEASFAGNNRDSRSASRTAEVKNLSIGATGKDLSEKMPILAEELSTAMTFGDLLINKGDRRRCSVGIL